jgi:hypothetical protein
MEAASYKLARGDLAGALASMEESEKILDKMPTVEPVIHASYYRVSADYYKVTLFPCNGRICCGGFVWVFEILMMFLWMGLFFWPYPPN